jgi:tryptophan-rich sensory protein
VLSILLPLIVGGVSGFFTTGSIEGWYITLNKPWFNPPNWIFGPVWTLLYLMMGIAFFLIWKSDAPTDTKKIAITVYFVQLVLNFAWSLIFFYMEQPGWALVDILLMWAAILYTILVFGKISSAAAWLLVPYICWVSFATVLNFAIWKLN